MDEARIAPDHFEARLQRVVVFLLTSGEPRAQQVFLDSPPQVSLSVDFDHHVLLSPTEVGSAGP